MPSDEFDVTTWLGLPAPQRVAEPELRLADAVRRGFTVPIVERLVREGWLTTADVDRLILPRRTLAHRKQRRQRLTRDESDRLARVARVLALAEETFGDREAARTWLRRSNRALAGQAPLELLDTDGGARAVEAVLVRVEHGVFE